MIFIKSTIYYNYEFRGKFLGIIDYKSLVIVASLIFFILGITNLLNVPYKITFVIMCIFMPFGALIFFCGNENESSIDIILNVIKFYINSGIYCVSYRDIRNNENIKSGVYKRIDYIN